MRVKFLRLIPVLALLPRKNFCQIYLCKLNIFCLLTQQLYELNVVEERLNVLFILHVSLHVLLQHFVARLLLHQLDQGGKRRAVVVKKQDLEGIKLRRGLCIY